MGDEPLALREQPHQGDKVHLHALYTEDVDKTRCLSRNLGGIDAIIGAKYFT